ncbi:hypothetical protein [Candidatus Binatus sp.]|uniref:hypothetical protein n=1 Tax=Candidatus Binatus sp. TaxID=2811406 RepID=UPI002F95D305
MLTGYADTDRGPRLLSRITLPMQDFAEGGVAETRACAREILRFAQDDGENVGPFYVILSESC